MIMHSVVVLCSALNVISDTCAFPNMLVNGSVDVTLAYPAVKTLFPCMLTRIACF